MSKDADTVDHVAISVQDIAASVDWYRGHFECEILYRDDSWALLQFANIKLALVLPSQHPSHLGFYSESAARYGTLKAHRDGTQSVYIEDPSGNSIELLAPAFQPKG